MKGQSDTRNTKLQRFRKMRFIGNVENILFLGNRDVVSHSNWNRGSDGFKLKKITFKTDLSKD